MDDGKRENNKIKQSKSESVKSIVSLYLNKRSFSNITPKKTSKKHTIRRALLDNSLSRCNSIVYSCYSSDPLVIEYNLMFQKFVYWLEYQTKHKHQCFDVEKLLGPLFCHFYLDIQSSGQFDKANTFFKTHIDKVDNSKCDETVNTVLKAITSASDITILNGADNFDDLKDKFRSNKVVTEITSESLKLLKTFVSDSSHIIFLHVLHTWFDLKIKDKVEQLNDLTKNSKVCQEEVKDCCSDKQYLQEQKLKLQDAITSVKKLPSCICNVGILNSKHLVTSGLIRRQAGLIAVAENNALLVMPLKSLDSIYSYENLDHVKFNNHSKQIYCVANSPNNDIICTGSADHKICIYSLSRLKCLNKLSGHLGPVYCIAISHNSKYILSGSQDTTARLWSLKSGNILRIFAGHSGVITSVDFHPNTLYIATGSADKNIRIWNLGTAQPVRLLHAAKREVYAVAFDPEGHYLACASDDKAVRIWDISSSKVLHELRFTDSSVIRLCWSSNSKHLCCAAINGVVKVWDISNHVKDKDKKKEQNSNPVLWKIINGRILNLEYSMGTWACLSIPKIGHSPLDAL